MEDALLALVPKARRRFAQTDPVMARILREHPPAARSLARRPAFAALVESISHQQVSLAAGRAIFGRVAEACGDGVTPASVLATGPLRLRAAGLSNPKVAYVLDLAARVSSREVDLDAFPAMSDDDVVASLTRVKGIGVWTAKMFLIFHLDRPDVLAHEDLGLQLATAEAYGVPREDAAATMRALHPKWSPYASLVALTLWNWRRATLLRVKSPSRG